MRTGDKGFIKFRFMYRPEYLKVGTTILFREGRTKGLGVVSRIFPDGAPLDEEGDLQPNQITQVRSKKTQPKEAKPDTEDV
jgi:hypothetical protein